MLVSTKKCFAPVSLLHSTSFATLVIRHGMLLLYRNIIWRRISRRQLSPAHAKWIKVVNWIDGIINTYLFYIPISPSIYLYIGNDFCFRVFIWNKVFTTNCIVLIQTLAHANVGPIFIGHSSGTNGFIKMNIWWSFHGYSSTLKQG